MNTPPPESEFPKPEPVPSLSMPVPQLALVDTSPPSANQRRRRHTMATRHDAAVELLSDGDDNEHDDQALDRISGILSSLLQEANDAVQNNNGAKSVYCRKSKTQPSNHRPRPHSALLRSSTSTNYNASSSSRPKSVLSLSRLPRPTRSTHYQRSHERYSSVSSFSSSASLFSPVPTTAESPITASSFEQPSSYFLDQQRNDNDNNDDKHNHDYDIIARSPTDILQPPSSSLQHTFYYGTETMNDETRQPHDDDHDIYQIEPPPSSASTLYTLPRFDDPLMESFRRLDSSMAMVESLSRDLAEQQEEHEGGEMASRTADQGLRLNSFISSTSTSKLALLFLPLLHIPHALITTVFDTLISSSSSSPGNTQTTAWPSSTSSSTTTSSSFVNASASFSGIVAWTLCFALANIVVTWSGAPSPYRFLTQQQRTFFSADTVRPRRLSLPGSYQPNNDTDAPYNNNTNHHWEYSHRMERSKRPTPINTTLCNNNNNKKPTTYSSSSSSIRRTPMKRSSPTSTRKRISNQQQQQQHRSGPSSTSMTVTQSNDRSYALAIQQSREWKKQQQQQQIPDDWEWIDGDNQQPLINTRRRYSF